MKNFNFFLCIVSILTVEYSSAQITDSIKSPVESKFEPLPIFYYDSNDGFGYGAKAFFLNFLKKK